MGWMVAVKKGCVKRGSDRKTSTLMGEDVDGFEGLKLKRARCL